MFSLSQFYLHNGIILIHKDYFEEQIYQIELTIIKHKHKYFNELIKLDYNLIEFNYYINL